ncbi:MAG TPA: 4a-hydroxytetrahydrobiopterin dehydratase [Bacilli bacterium]
MSMCKLSEEQVTLYLGKLQQWKYENNSITKKFKHGDFKESIAFINAVADLAEKANHHPDLLIQYDQVTITLSTHDKHGVTGKDFSLAQEIDGVYRSAATGGILSY